MTFKDLKDSNGTALQSYAEILQEKAREAGLVTLMVFASKEQSFLHVVTNVAGDPARIMARLAAEMREPENDRQIITPVSPGAAN